MKSFLLVIVALLAACDGTRRDGDLAGGSAVEGETIRARLVDNRGSALGTSLVELRLSAQGAAVATASTDDSGHVVLQAPVGVHELWLAVSDPDRPGEWILFHILLSSELDTTLEIFRWGSLTGTVSPPPGWTARRVSLPAAGLTDSVQNGSFAFAHVPPGTWSVQLAADSAGSARTFPIGDVVMPQDGRDISGAFAPRLEILASQGFESGTATTCIKTLTTPYLLHVGRGCDQLDSSTGAYSGRSLRLGVDTASAAIRSAWIAFQPATGGRNLGSGDTLRFQLRGSGAFRLSAWTSGPAMRDTLLVATALWTSITVPLATLLAQGDSLAPQNGVQIVASEQSFLVLDDFLVFADSP